eukprot:8263496-Ditylum_brightwellii.AAC.1
MFGWSNVPAIHSVIPPQCPYCWFVGTKTRVPGGSRDMQLKSNTTFNWASAEGRGFNWEGCIMFK